LQFDTTARLHINKLIKNETAKLEATVQVARNYEIINHLATFVKNQISSITITGMLIIQANKYFIDSPFITSFAFLQKLFQRNLMFYLYQHPYVPKR
jgi:hypothetical protein